MNFFERIQQRQGLENFCTNILVGILEKDENLLKRFCVQVLNIPEYQIVGQIKIESQGYYKANELCTQNSFIDIEISGTEFLCFLEMKVESSQNSSECINHRQLPKYNTALLGKKVTHSYLRFCTKYKEFVPEDDKKDFLSVNGYFEQLRWHNIYKFLSDNFENNELVNEFLEFLDSKNMSDRMTIDNKKIENNELGLGNSIKLFEKLEIILNEIKNQIDINSFFQNKPENVRLDFLRKRYGLHYLVAKKPLTTCFIGFEFDDNKIKQVIWIWSENFKESSFYKTKLGNENNLDINKGIKEIKELTDDSLESILNWFLENKTFKALGAPLAN